MDAGTWLSSVQSQVISQYKSLKQNPNQVGFIAAFTSTMLISGGASLYSQYTSKYTFNGEVQIQLSTDGKFLVGGRLNYAYGLLNFTARLYADISNVGSGTVKILFLADIPSSPRFAVLAGKFEMGFTDSSGNIVEIDHSQAPAEIPNSSFYFLIEGSLSYYDPIFSYELFAIDGKIKLTIETPASSPARPPWPWTFSARTERRCCRS